MLHFVYNPIAGKGRSVQFRTALEGRLRALGVEHAFHETHRRREAIDIARKLTAGAAGEPLDLVAMGGDGTLNEVLNGIADPSKVHLGIIPCGSGNDFAAVAGIPQTPEGALDTLLHGEAKPTDFLECSGVRGINAIGTGIDVEILRRYARMNVLHGSAAYLASLILTLFSYRAKAFREVAEGGEKPHRALIACCGNGQCIGGGIPVCPEAAIDDGLMDIVIVDDISRPRIPGAFMKLMKRQILTLPSTDFKRASALRLASDGPMPVQIDGEIYEDLPFDVHLVTGQLRVYRP